MPETKGRKPKFGYHTDGSNIENYNYRIPLCAIDAINKLLVIKHPLLARSKGKVLTVKQLVSGVLKDTQTGAPNTISFTKEDIESMNLRCLGWFAYKLQLQDSPKEVKKDDQQSMIDQICAKLELN